ncbi:MAG: YkgJ family cysteine cluster protein [Candidatus Margulisbacteria bacterium]|nr:YkgJ family cysteine cluster protein [Candidatus Margulisiibacteriota bacterium]
MLNTKENLENLWHQTKEKKLFRLKNILKDFWLTLKYDLRFIDPKQVQLKINPLQVPDCKTCSRNCCRGVENTVSLRLIDIARLIDAGLTKFIDKNNKIHIQKEIAEKHPRILRNIKSDTWRKFPVLKRVNDICPLLDNKNNCTIYNVRPLTCRRYPYTLMDNMKEIKFSKYCINPKTIEKQNEYSQEMFNTAIEVYNEKVKDLILIHHAKKELQEIGIYNYLI